MAGPRVLAVNFHYVRPRGSGDYPGLHVRTPEELAAQLDALAAHARFLAPERLAAWLAGHADLEPGDHFTLTFDDGLRDQIDAVAPEVERRGWRVFFFVSTRPWEGELLGVHRLQILLATAPFADIEARLAALGPVEGAFAEPDLARIPEDQVRGQYRYDDLRVARLKFAINFLAAPGARARLLGRLFRDLIGADEDHLARLYLTPAQAGELARRGHVVGLHSHGHQPLAALPEDEVARDLARNRDLVRGATGADPWAVSYPYGGRDAVSPAVVRVSRAMGLRIGFTMTRGFIENAAHDPLALPRVDTNDAPGGKTPRFDLRAGGVDE